MKKTLFQAALVFIILAVFSHTVHATYCFSETYGVSLRSMAMGQAFTAVADDYSAVYFNPAGLAQDDRTTISFELIQPIHDMSVKYLESGTDMKMYDVRGFVMNDPVRASDGDNLNLLFPVIGISANINRLCSSIVDIPLNIQAALMIGLPENLNSLFTTNTTPPDMPNLISFGDQIEHFMASFGLGFEIKKDLLYFGWSTTTGIEMAGSHPLYTQNVWLGLAGESRNIITQADAPSTIVLGNQWGVLFTPYDKKLKIGFSYRESLNVVLVDFTPIRVYLTSTGIPQDGLKVLEDVIIGYMPEQWSFGLAYEFDVFTVSFDYKYLKWSDYPYTKSLYQLYVVNEPGTAQAGRVPEPGSPDFDDVSHISLGMEYRHNRKLTLMAGYEYRPTQVPDQSYRISNYLDMDKDIFSVGLNYKINGWFAVGGLFQYMMLDDYKVYKTGDEIGYAWGWDHAEPQRSYKVEGDAFVFGLSFEFTL